MTVSPEPPLHSQVSPSRRPRDVFGVRGVGFVADDERSDVAVEEAAQGGYLVTQALARGQRRQLHVAGRFIASVDVAAPAGCQSAFGAAKRGQIETAAGNAANDEETSAWEVREAAKRMKRIGKAKAKGKTAPNGLI